jgi:hypothetical protein
MYAFSERGDLSLKLLSTSITHAMQVKEIENEVEVLEGSHVK